MTPAPIDDNVNEQGGFLPPGNDDFERGNGERAQRQPGVGWSTPGEPTVAPFEGNLTPNQRLAAAVNAPNGEQQRDRRDDVAILAEVMRGLAGAFGPGTDASDLGRRLATVLGISQAPSAEPGASERRIPEATPSRDRRAFSPERPRSDGRVLLTERRSLPESRRSPDRASDARVLVPERAIDWLKSPIFPGRHPEVDDWFVGVEGRLKGYRVPRGLWLERLMENPRFPEDEKRMIDRLRLRERDWDPEDLRVKELLQGAPAAKPGAGVPYWALPGPENRRTPYDRVRRYILAKYGPIDPVAVHRTALYRVRGDDPSQVERELKRILELYNRAAEDIGCEQWSERELAFPFMLAFGEEHYDRLLSIYGQVADQPTWWRTLTAAAPKAGIIKDVPMVAYVEPSVGTSASGGTAAEIRELRASIAALQEERSGRRLFSEGNFRPREERNRPGGPPMKRARGSRGSRPKNGPCPTCGQGCADPESCPAKTRACSKCQKIGHFAKVCPDRLAAGREPSRQRDFR